jgi:ribosomal-protein-alanine N-acetyltransferase
VSAEPKALFRIRPLVSADLPEVLAIERAAYEFPWSEGVFRDCLRLGYRCLAAVDLGGDLLGYSLLSMAVGEAHILNVCVSRPHRRQGVATMLLESMIRIARREHAECLLLEVRPSNTAALGLYRRLGFKRMGLRKRYYPAVNGREDALLLARTLVVGF